MADKQNMKLDKPFDLDAPLDSIEELPGFGAWPTGGYTILLGLEVKDINEKKALEVKFTHKETAELGEPTSLTLSAPAPGDVCSCVYFLDNKVALSNMAKELLPAIKAKFGSNNLTECIKAANGATALVILKRDHDKDKDKDYMRIKTLAFL